MYRLLSGHIICFLLLAAQPLAARSEDPRQLVQAAMEYWRSSSSYTEVDMTIHRPDWQRRMSLRSWTRGSKDALIIFTAPRADAGNATLKLDRSMWMFSPKLNQVIKLPASMMTQSWMGSDFSYNDLAKSDQIIDQYEHRLLSREVIDGHTVYTIESIPHDNAPIVWGKEVLRIRDDYILLQEDFYDQDMQPVRSMKTLKIGPLGGREIALVMRMTQLEKKDHWTEIVNRRAYFDLPLANYLFSLSNLRNPRPWKAP